LADNDFILKEGTNIIKDFFKNNEKTTKFKDGSKIDFSYYIMDQKELDSTFQNKRYTKKYMRLSDNFDNIQFEKAIIANFIQSFDACLVRMVLEEMFALTVHDCFLTDYLNISKLLNCVNKCMNRAFHNINNMNEEIWSLFIIL